MPQFQNSPFQNCAKTFLNALIVSFVDAGNHDGEWLGKWTILEWAIDVKY